MAVDVNRRSFLTSLIVVPAIVRIEHIMPVKMFREKNYILRMLPFNIIDAGIEKTYSKFGDEHFRVSDVNFDIDYSHGMIYNSQKELYDIAHHLTDTYLYAGRPLPSNSLTADHLNSISDRITRMGRSNGWYSF